MTYLQFLALFIAPLLLLAALHAHRTRRAHPDRPWRTGLTVLALLWAAAWVWTTPWDSWIIHRGVWSYPEGRVLATVFRVPLEEYVFMAAQTLIVGLWTLSRIATGTPDVTLNTRCLRVSWGNVWLLAASAGAAMALHGPSGTYLGSMLLWFAPLLAVQSYVGADVLHACRPIRLTSLLPVAACLWIADRIAIALGIWQISTTRTYGPTLLGLPLEEALFFLLTSLLVTNGLVLATHPRIRHRLRLPTAEARSPRHQVAP
ncbi:phytoene synthase [Streptomyces spiroverticillatus]|uniref:Phytoene synthase n=1 Tax=Streptomyces finlayi TaxID=67296 RepID=A0A918X8W7_9ACTN|nr:lycopene cyclase domain-containing protein [Streptomyces finlayi]GHA47275.1 phytoene synthase [Streptomyces spiroverticillatus]GHD18600.1 phytoene synthase [Streptomyces finlayi]